MSCNRRATSLHQLRSMAAMVTMDVPSMPRRHRAGRHTIGTGMLMMAISGSLMGFSNPLGESNASHGLRCPPASFLTVGGNTLEKPDSQADGTHHLHFTGGSIGIAAGGAVSLALAGAVTRRTTSTVTRETGSETTLQRLMPVVLILILVCQKCCADALTWLSKAKMHMVYSGSNVTLVSEVLKFPVLLSAVAIFCSPKDVVPTIKAAVTESPWRLWWVGLLYAVQNLLYFVCLQYTSAAAYQVLSQTKTIFTAAFMWQLMGRKFTMTQLTALLMLVAGTVFTQLAEIQGPVSAGSRPWLGASLAVLSALLSALPNVFYERLLKEVKVIMEKYPNIRVFADQTKPAKLPDPNESMPPPAPPVATNGMNGMNGMAPPWQHGQHPHAHAPSTPNGCQHLVLPPPGVPPSPVATPAIPR